MARPVQVEPKKDLLHRHFSNENADTSLDDDATDVNGQKGDKRKFYPEPNPLPEPLRTWRREMKTIWLEEKTTKGVKIREYLFSVVFAGSKDPFDAALTLAQRVPDYTIQKPNSLSGTILREFEHWLNLPTTNKEKLFEEFVDESCQIRAFKLGTANHTCHLEVIIRIFHLNEAPSDGNSSIKEKLVPLIHEMIRDCKFKDAMHSAQCLNVQSSFTLEDLVVPCVLQDRLMPVESYVAGNKELQRELVVYFDNLLAPRFNFNRFVEQWKEHGVTAVRRDKWQGKTLQKLVGRLLKTFDLPSELAPNLRRSRTQGTIRHVCFKRYTEQSLSDANFSDYVEDLIRVHPEMKSYLLDQLVYQKQLKEAARWAVKFNCKKGHMPIPVIHYMNAHPECSRQAPNVDSSLPADVTDSVNATSLVLPDRIHQSIRIVDDREGLAECVDQLFNSSSAGHADGGEVLIGLDTEWRPLFLCSNEQVALIQIATKDCAFLIDVLALESILSEQEWICFFEQLLCTDEAFKLGFDFAGDLRTIAQTLPFCRDVLSGTKNVVCLVQLVKNLCRLDSSFAEDLCASRDGEGSSVDNHNQSTASSSTGDCSLDQSIAESVEDGGGAIVGELPVSSQRQKTHSTSQVHFKLTDLCAHLLGRPLDKSEQFGNWAKRPLRPEQIRYAALDAYCQIEIFNELKCKAQELLIDWEDVVARSTVDISAGTKAEHKKSRARQPKKKMTDAEFRDLIQRLNAATLCDQNGEKTQSPKDVRVAVDSMIQGLGKHLRRCGVDTVIAEDGRSARDTLVKLARTDQRFVLTSGKAYMGLRQRIPNSIVCVPASDENSPLSQLEFVLQHFRVHVREEDIFSRCMVCNCAHFLFVPMPVMKAVYNAVVVTRDLFNPKPFNKTAAITTMNAIDAAVYEGHGAVVKTDGQRVLVECDGGCLDVERGVILDSWTSTEVDGIVLKESVKVKVEALFPNSFVDGRVFFVCFECGKVYWDGSHISNYMSTYGETVLGRESDVTESP